MASYEGIKKSHLVGYKKGRKFLQGMVLLKSYLERQEDKTANFRSIPEEIINSEYLRDPTYSYMRRILIKRDMYGNITLHEDYDKRFVELLEMYDKIQQEKAQRKQEKKGL